MKEEFNYKDKINHAKLSNLIDSYLSSISKNKSKFKMARFALKIFFDFYSERSFISNKNFAKDYFTWLQSSKKLSINSTKNYISSLRLFLNFLVQNDILVTNPFSKLKVNIKNNANEFRFLNDNQIETLFQQDINDYLPLRNRFIFILSLFTDSNINQIINFKENDFEEVVYSSIYMTAQIKKNIELYLEYLIESKNELFKSEYIFFSIGKRNYGKLISERNLNEILRNEIQNIGFKGAPNNIIKNTKIILHFKKNRSQDLLKRDFGIKSNSVLMKYIYNYYKVFDIS